MHVDLHLHTNHSDGSDTPTRVVERAAALGLAAMAITDHDTLSGLAEAREAAATHGIEFLPGTEVSAEYNGKELHILGLGVDPDSEELLVGLDLLRQRRSERADEMIERLNKLGVPAQRESIEASTADGLIGRVHIAQEIVRLGHATHIQDAFDKYIKQGRSAFIVKKAIPASEAIDLIHLAGGLAFIAHPGIGKQEQRLDKLLTLPFDGIEVYHSRHNADRVRKFGRVVRDRDLLATGGSDCHGNVKGDAPLMGNANVPVEVYQRIRDALDA